MTHIKTYTKKDGTVVPAHNDKRSGPMAFILKHAPHVAKLFGQHAEGHEEPVAPAPGPKNLKPVNHPLLQKPSQPAPQAPPTKPQGHGSSSTPKLSTGWQPSKPSTPSSWGSGPSKGPSGGPPPPHKPHKPHYPNAKPHRQLDEDGKVVQINEPSTPTSPASWTDPKAVATVVPGGKLPDHLNGIAFKPWEDHPETPEEWDEVPGQDHSIWEPPFEEGFGKPAAGVVVEEADGRVWVIHPTNRFGGYKATFPKGRIEEGINLQASAIKEAFEESGLQVEITGFLDDVERSVTTCRYYTARRVGGTPSEMGWESQAVSLVPRSQLYKVLNQHVDHPLAEALGAGPMPPPPPPPPKPKAPDYADGFPESLFGDLLDG